MPMSLQKKPVVIYQPDRILIAQQVKKYARYITGIVLDVGSGKSNRYKHLFQYQRYITLDPNQDAGAEITAEAENIPLPENFVDSIVSTQVLEHVKNPWKVINEFGRVLKPGGYCLLTAPQWNNLHEEPHDYWRYTKYGLAKIFEENGFKIIEMDQRGKYFTTLSQIKIRFLIDKLHLYESKFWKLWNIYFRFTVWKARLLDEWDNSSAASTHAIGWCLIAQKI